MLLNLASVKWGRVLAWGIAGLIIAVVGNLLLQLLYGLVLGIQLRGSPPQDVLMAAWTSPLWLFIAALWAGIGALVGGRTAARGHERDHLFAGLVTGIIVALLAVAWRIFSWGPDFWLAIHAVLAIAGGALGGWLARRARGEEWQAA
jgi:hypothetical protein